MLRRASAENVALSGLTLFCSSIASAKVEVRAVQHKSAGLILAAKISEDIAPGDYELLLKGILANPGRYARKVVLLDSIGGSLPEAIRMGRLLREAGFEALVPRAGICQGTCIYLLAAGQKRTVRGHVGLHRPYFPNGDSALANAAANAHNYSSASYFREMGVASNLLVDMQQIPPQQMRVLSRQELAGYRLN